MYSRSILSFYSQCSPTYTKIKSYLSKASVEDWTKHLLTAGIPWRLGSIRTMFFTWLHIKIPELPLFLSNVRLPKKINSTSEHYNWQRILTHYYQSKAICTVWQLSTSKNGFGTTWYFWGYNIIKYGFTNRSQILRIGGFIGNGHPILLQLVRYF